MQGPDFLVIGAPRAGTTWLYERLAEHDQAWLPPIKELHYFDVERPGAPRAALAGRYYRHNAGGLLRRAVRRDLGPGGLRWASRYLCGRRGDRWYATLFAAAQQRGLRSGDITPGYMALDPAEVTTVAATFPAARIILMLRHPVDGVWSMVRKLTVGDAALDAQQVLDVIDSKDVRLRADYPRALSVWGEAFPAEQLFVGFFDDLVAAPERLLAELFAFLGLDPGHSPAPERASGAVNRGRERELPPTVERALIERYLGDVEQLAARFAGPAQRWLDDLRARQRRLAARRGTPH
ncbi:MAG: sulfotransferase [Planctomycetota bacterium]